MSVTNKELLEFYAGMDDKSKDYPITRKYMESHELSGAYIKLANTFKSKGKSGSTENKNFYHWIEENHLNPTSLSFLKETDPGFDSLLERTGLKDPLLQKWHLYVSWYALEEYWEREGTHKKSQFTTNELGLDVQESYSGILRKTNPISCRALLLWMCEASDSEQTDKLYSQLEIIEEKLNAANKQLSDWLQAIKDEILNRVQNGESQK